MALIPTALHEEALAGDIAALHTIKEGCKRGTLYSMSHIFSLVFQNLRPEARRTTLMLYGESTEAASNRKWLTGVVLCLSCLSYRITYAFTLRSTLPPALARQIRENWKSHIWPSIFAVSKLFVLDEWQPTICTTSTADPAIGKLKIYKAEAFDIVSFTIESLKKPRGVQQLEPNLTGPVDIAYHLLISELAVEFIELYAYDPRAGGVRTLALFHELKGDDVLHSLDSDPRLIPAILKFMKRYNRCEKFACVI